MSFFISLSGRNYHETGCLKWQEKIIITFDIGSTKFLNKTNYGSKEESAIAFIFDSCLDFIQGSPGTNTRPSFPEISESSVGGFRYEDTITR